MVSLCDPKSKANHDLQIGDEKVTAWITWGLFWKFCWWCSMSLPCFIVGGMPHHHLLTKKTSRVICSYLRFMVGRFQLLLGDRNPESINEQRAQKSGQIITTSAEVTPNGGLVRESPPNPLNSGLGIIVICPEKSELVSPRVNSAG